MERIWLYIAMPLGPDLSGDLVSESSLHIAPFTSLWQRASGQGVVLGSPLSSPLWSPCTGDKVLSLWLYVSKSEHSGDASLAHQCSHLSEISSVFRFDGKPAHKEVFLSSPEDLITPGSLLV